MATGDEAWAIGESWQDKEHGGNLSALVTHQGIPDCGLVPAKIEGRGYEGRRPGQCYVGH